MNLQSALVCAKNFTVLVHIHNNDVKHITDMFILQLANQGQVLTFPVHALAGI